MDGVGRIEVKGVVVCFWERVLGDRAVCFSVLD